jgi:hypothetical protein
MLPVQFPSETRKCLESESDRLFFVVLRHIIGALLSSHWATSTMLRIYLLGALLVVSVSCLSPGGEMAFVNSGMPRIQGSRMPSRRCLLRMDSGNGEVEGMSNGKLQELIQTRSKLLQEKAELLKKRKQALVQDISKLERDKQAMPKLPPAVSRAGATETPSQFDGIFGQPVSQENMSRRSMINTIFTGVAVTVGGIGVLGVLLAPGIEKLAYLSFASIFEEGAIYLTRQTEKVHTYIHRYVYMDFFFVVI